ncbi:TetR/AcrR family transcriptional regulator [Actinomadura algeriensis]|uniref:AcrR family transcriptional regulator n=1 Tax=Actinomadura algeriensis TaxID=1679523 RepID=A0ABR9JTJ8_9ACTN|nr:TetR/AcrR family transcriptional regulator [Actinomadura algeriensis]MBE1533833.1 AcrR family transcriptional regulator [Actinomadura algeriensis]
MNPDDPRVRRTRARLRSAILELAAERDLDAVTISAVAERAEVNRATVYLHYPDIDALVVDAMDDAIGHVARAAALCPRQAEPDRVPEPLAELFAHVAANAAVYRCMLGGQGSARFAARMRERLTAALTERFAAGARPSGPADVPADLHAAYLAGALQGVIIHWITGPHPAPAPEIALPFWRLFRG